MRSLSVRRLVVTLFAFSVLGAAFPLGNFRGVVFCRGEPRFTNPPPSPDTLTQRHTFLARRSAVSKDDSDDMTEQKSNTALPRFDGEFDKDDDDAHKYCDVVDEFGALAAERFCEANDETGGAFRWIRLEKQQDKSLQSVKTKHDVLEQIRLAIEEQAKYGNAALFARRWKHLENGVLNGFAVDGSDDDSSFTVLQFNTLAEGLSAGPDTTCPFTVKNDSYGRIDKNTYGGFTSVKHPEMVLNFSLRRWRVLETIIGNQGTCPFDVVALEEVDRYYGFFSPLMRLFGYEGVFIPKSASPGVRMGWYSDGCALLWKKDKFELISERRVEYKVGSQVLLLAALRHRAADTPMVVAVTHLKAQKSETNEKIRCAQVEEIVTRVKEELTVVREAFKTAAVPVLILGDFNADAPPQTEGTHSAVRTLLNSNVSPNDVPCSLKSAYEVDENFYTTWKTRGTSTTRRIIDYIFFGGNLSCRAHLAVPEPEELGEAKLPSFRHPSDHMSIAAKFDFT